MRSKPIARPGRRSKRVAAWIYTVVNPLIETLHREAELLERGNLTWRSHSRRCEYIRPIQEYIENPYVPNYQDFLADNAEFQRRFNEHDNAVAKAEEKATQFFDLLVSASDFQSQVARSLEAYESRLDPSQPQRPSLAYMKEDLAKYVAEYLINRVDSLPHHYTMHSFWEQFANEFDLSKHEFEPYTQRQTSRSLEQAADILMQVSNKLRQSLEDYRLSLCRKYDIPAAPVAPARSEAEDVFSF